MLWNAFDVSFSYDFYDGDILCMRPASDTQTLRVLGSSGTLPQNTALSLADPEADGTPSFQGLASVNDPTTGDVLFLESVSRVWRVHDGSNDIPAWMLYADPDDAALPLDAITSITVDASGNAPAGLALSRWDEPSRTWQRIGAGAGTADVTHEARDVASLDALWGERRDPLRIAVTPDDGVGPIELTGARVRTRYVLP